MADLLHLLLFTISIIQICLIRLTNADARTELVSKSCVDGTLQNGSVFLSNYWEANELMKHEISIKTFGSVSKGDSPDNVFLMAQCYGDLSEEQCEECYSVGSNLIPSCLPHPGGRAYLDGCYIRADNYNFDQEIFSSEDDIICGSGKDETGSYSDMVRSALWELIDRAANSDGYADGSNNRNNETVYTLANCWKTLEYQACSSCLESAMSSVLACLPASEGRALKAGCFIRYSSYSFINNSKVSASDKTTEFIIYVLACTTLAVSAIWIGVFMGKIIYSRQNNQPRSRGNEGDLSLFKRSLRFKYSTIEKATNHFSEANKLGQGGFGEVFKGCLGDGREIAVKRLFVSANNRAEEVYNEMNVISRAHHRNLVRFLGCSLTSLDSLLVYEFLPNKSLNLFLFDPEKKKELDWNKRIGIIKGTAEGLAYLHEDCEVVVVHRDIKASNILLDLKFRPKIADFGLARFCCTDDNPDGVAIAGTLGYMAPEYITHGQLTEKVDVFSYGVLLLEIVTGIQNNKFTSDESLETLVTRMWKHLKTNRVMEMIDKDMEVEDEEEVKRIVQVGLLCTQMSPSLRPTMKETIQMLKHKDRHLPLPSKPPFFDESLGSLTSIKSCDLRDFDIHDHQIDDVSKSHSYTSTNDHPSS